MPGLVIVGAQWGDEGKGKLTDYLAEGADAVVRYQGGNNAGHTVIVDDVPYSFHMVPSGAAKKVPCFLAAGTVIPLDKLHEELATVPKEWGLEDRLFIDGNATLITEIERSADVAQENSGQGVGSTKNGIAQSYAGRAHRFSLTPNLVANGKEEDLLLMLSKQAEQNNFAGDVRTVLSNLREDMKQYTFVNVPEELRILRETGKNIIFEGAQGVFLDYFYGTYPGVTSSHPGAGGACVGAGVPPNSIDHVIGVVKLVQTRVGDGPMITQLVDEELQKNQVDDFVYEMTGHTAASFKALTIAEQYRVRKGVVGDFDLTKAQKYVMDHLEEAQALMRGEYIDPSVFENLNVMVRNEKDIDHIIGMYLMVKAGEFGATTGRPRRVAWLDAVLLRSAHTMNGFSAFAVTHLDSLAGLEHLKICNGHTYDGITKTHYDPATFALSSPKYQILDGWNAEEVQRAQRYTDLPKTAQHYIRCLEDLTSVPVCMVGTGPATSLVREEHMPW